MRNVAKFRNVFLFFLGGAVLLGSAAHAGCNAALRHEAEVSTPNIADWDDYYFAARRYADCDTPKTPDARMEATYRAKTTLLLTTRQGDFYRVIAFNRKDPAIADFLVGHIDPAMPAAQAAQIRGFIEARCKVAGNNICARIVKALPAK